MTNVIHKIHKDKWSEKIKQFYSNTFRRITPSSVGRLIELNVEAARTTCVQVFKYCAKSKNVNTGAKWGYVGISVVSIFLVQFCTKVIGVRSGNRFPYLQLVDSSLGGTAGLPLPLRCEGGGRQNIA